MITDDREVSESPKVQGDDEERAYSFDFGPAGVVLVASAAMEVLDLTSSSLDITATVMPGTPTASGAVVTTPVLKALAAYVGHELRVLCRATHDGGQLTELFCRVFVRT